MSKPHNEDRLAGHHTSAFLASFQALYAERGRRSKKGSGKIGKGETEEHVERQYSEAEKEEDSGKRTKKTRRTKRTTRAKRTTRKRKEGSQGKRERGGERSWSRLGKVRAPTGEYHSLH